VPRPRRRRRSSGPSEGLAGDGQDAHRAGAGNLIGGGLRIGAHQPHGQFATESQGRGERFQGRFGQLAVGFDVRQK
jgi:hypothetical protein